MSATQDGDANKQPTSVPGNASNPPANETPAPDGNQLLGKEAEKYLREGGNIEDLPGEEDWQEAEKLNQEDKAE